MGLNGHTEKPKVQVNIVNVKMDPRLKDLLERAADAGELPMNEYIVRVLARHFKRPDLGQVPRNRMGRPRIGV